MLALFAVAYTGTLSAQDEILVTAPRIDKQISWVPAAVSVVEQADIQTARQQLGLDESLNRVPGLFFQNRYNFTQDLRVSIRGFGARANFGIRGIKVLVDDIPSTLADGQSGVDDIDLGSAQRIEAFRGPSSSLYGSASGGVINIYTEDGPKQPFVNAGVIIGEYDQQKYQLKAGGQYRKLNYLVNASHLTMDGYRDHARVEHNLFNSKLSFQLDDSAKLKLVFNVVDSPTAEDAGALTLVDAEANPRQAQARNLSSNAGESLDQQKLGLIFEKTIADKHELILRNYYTWRNFKTFLPIGTHIPFVADDGVVAFERFFFGGGGQYRYSGSLLGRANRFVIGFDVDRQEDDRQRFINNAGSQGALSFDQLEEATVYGIYFRNEWSVSDTLELTLGGRYDDIKLSVNDQFLSNGDQSSELNFNEFSPTVGISWRLKEDIYLYANYATAFETPTFTELSNPARNLNVNLGGFNNVNAQNADSIELGIKASWNERFYIDVAAYSMDVDDEITSISNLGSRSFFENADTERKGVEAMLIAQLFDGLKWTASYTHSDFEFTRFSSNTSLQGNSLPGIPEHQFFTELSYQHESGAYLVWDWLLVDGFFTNNANTVSSDAYQVSNLRLGSSFDKGGLRISPYFGINNLFDEDYHANIRINAFGGRFFEPAPDRHIYAGININYTY